MVTGVPRLLWIVEIDPSVVTHRNVVLGPSAATVAQLAAQSAMRGMVTHPESSRVSVSGMQLEEAVEMTNWHRGVSQWEDPQWIVLETKILRQLAMLKGPEELPEELPEKFDDSKTHDRATASHAFPMSYHYGARCSLEKDPAIYASSQPAPQGTQAVATRHAVPRKEEHGARPLQQPLIPPPLKMFQGSPPSLDVADLFCGEPTVPVVSRVMPVPRKIAEPPAAEWIQTFPAPWKIPKTAVATTAST